MKLNIFKLEKINQTNSQFYVAYLTLTFAVLLVTSLVSLTNIGNNVFAQTDPARTSTATPNTDTNTTIATDQESSLHPQIVLIIEEEGKITYQRVLEVNPHPVIESTFVANTTILGNIQARDLGTYWATIYPNGSVHGEGHGLSTTLDGEIVTWTGEGVGITSPEGEVRLEGSLFFRTSSTGELSYLNNKVGFFDYEVDSEGNTSASVWELR
ncbi:MAG TPA: hypothetical protein VD815_04010 [Candidatus Saccharimonadales bacterium]|nr:hypothetical protein [Candidatus Saccharimonadales bacterium]